jgi:hypothetical protein
MHALRLALIGWVCLGGLAPMAGAAPAPPHHATTAAPLWVAAAERQCPPGYHYESGHYAKHGKWRDAGCWPN